MKSTIIRNDERKSVQLQQQKRTPMLTALCLICLLFITLVLSVSIKAYFSFESKDALTYLVLFFLELLVFVGILQMWQVKKSGFYLFTTSQLTLALLPIISHTVDSAVGLFSIP